MVMRKVLEGDLQDKGDFHDPAWDVEDLRTQQT